MDNLERKMSLNEFVEGNNTIQSSTELRQVSPEEIAKVMQEKTGITPEEKPKTFDSYIDEVIEKYGKPASDQLFEQAKEILEQRAIEMEMNEIENGEDEDSFNGKDTSDDLYYDEEDEDLEGEEVSDIQSSTDSIIRDLSKEFEDEFDDEEDIEKTNYDKQIEAVKSQLKEKLSPVTKKIDLASFTVRNKPISVFKAFENSTLINDINISDWVLFDSGIKISVKEMRAYDIEKLNPRNSRRNEYNTFKDIYTLIYEHIVNEDKPSLEEFLKLVKFTDIPNLYFAIFRSSFNKNNVVTYTCDKCNHIFVEDVHVDEMYKFTSPEIEKEFNDIMAKDTVFTAKEYVTNMIQISDEYVVSLREPSIFNVVFETLAVNENFRNKYSDIMAILTYIDSFYLIDRTSNELIPIGLKVYENDLGKTIRYKILNYSKILSSLTSDQFYILSSAIEKITPEVNIKYIRPERECPKCKHKIAEEEQSPDDMLFTRHQMGALVNM